MVKNPCLSGHDSSRLYEIKDFVNEAAKFWEGKPEIALGELYHKALLYKINKEKLSGEAAKAVADVFAQNLYNRLYYKFLYSVGLAYLADEPEKFDVLTYALLDKKYDEAYDINKI